MKVSIKFDKEQKKFLENCKYSSFSRSVIIGLLEQAEKYCNWSTSIDELVEVQDVLNDAIKKINEIKTEA